MSDVDELNLEMCGIRRLNDQDVAAMRQAAKQFRLLGSTLVFPGQTEWSDFRDRELPWVLELNLPPGDFGEIHDLAQHIARSVETALRIVSHRYPSVFLPVLFQSGVEDSLAGQYTLGRSDFPDLPSLRYHLAQEHVPLIQRVHKVASETKDERVRVAIRRFLVGYGRGDDDSVIDLWIGLEALFGGGSGEIMYKAAMRIANYTGFGSWFFRDLQNSYNVRSRLVHGEHPANTKSARQTARDALRFSLLKLLNEGAAPDVHLLDASIAAGAKR